MPPTPNPFKTVSWSTVSFKNLTEVYESFEITNAKFNLAAVWKPPTLHCSQQIENQLVRRVEEGRIGEQDVGNSFVTEVILIDPYVAKIVEAKRRSLNESKVKYHDLWKFNGWAAYAWGRFFVLKCNWISRKEKNKGKHWGQSLFAYEYSAHICLSEARFPNCHRTNISDNPK